jgi:hypothetical protein
MSIVLIVIGIVIALGLFGYGIFSYGTSVFDVVDTKTFVAKQSKEDFNLNPPTESTSARKQFTGWSDAMITLVHPGLHFRHRGDKLILVGRRNPRAPKTRNSYRRRAMNVKPVSRPAPRVVKMTRVHQQQPLAEAA